jgi:hypothetical protein
VITKERYYIDKNIDLNGYIVYCAPMGVHIHIYVTMQGSVCQFVGLSLHCKCRDLIAKNSSGRWWQ